MGVASLVLGIIGLVLAWVPYVGVVLALIGLILGFVAVRKKPADGSPPKGKGLSTAGLVLSIIGFVLGGYWTYKVTRAVNQGMADFDKAMKDGTFKNEMDKAFKDMGKDMEKDLKKAGEEMKQDMEKAKDEAKEETK